MTEIMETLRATMTVPVAVGVAGWGGLALMIGQVVRATADEVRDLLARRKRKHYQPRQLGTCVTGKRACHECMLGDGFCRKEVERHNPD